MDSNCSDITPPMIIIKELSISLSKDRWILNFRASRYVFNDHSSLLSIISDMEYLGVIPHGVTTIVRRRIQPLIIDEAYNGKV